MKSNLSILPIKDQFNIIKSNFSVFLFFIFSMSTLNSCASETGQEKLEVSFNKGYGEIEIGSKFAGLEFHHSRPLPSRISFYYPVANSIDFSKDYWQRDQSFPLHFILKENENLIQLGKKAYSYSYTPISARFSGMENELEININYNFLENLPAFYIKTNLKNISDENRKFSFTQKLLPGLRSSHTYKNLAVDSLIELENGKIITAHYYSKDVDSTVIFCIDLSTTKSFTTNENIVEPKQSIQTELIIGSCRISEIQQMLKEIFNNWKNEIESNQEKIFDYSFKQSKFVVADSSLQKTAHWAKAVIAANQHYIDKNVLPMPCPAEYNFFFTHDFLLTSLGVVNFDTDYIKNGYNFLLSLTKKDSILPHAYYWKDGKYVTEYCYADNWNHLWIVITATSYLKHSGDLETLKKLYPVIKKSLNFMLSNKGADGLMHAKRPDWWDTGNNYGARTYITTLVYKALQDYTFITASLNTDVELNEVYLKLAEELKFALNEKLWDEEKGYLLNKLHDGSTDYHYYSGSLLAAAFNLLDKNRKSKLLKTAEEKLLDKNLGIRNAMPPDFHKHIELYKFNGMESGEPYSYFNGGVWPHGNIWYSLALMSNNNYNAAKEVLKKYSTLDGINNSPNGQLSFYEFRTTNPEADDYGRIHKPTFLWAGGLYLHALYKLCGLKENSWNIYFDSMHPDDLHDANFDVYLSGKKTFVTTKGKGKFFNKIIVDGELSNSAVIIKQSDKISLQRGVPVEPYLASADCIVTDVNYDTENSEMIIDYIFYPEVQVKIVSPLKLSKSTSYKILSIDEYKFDNEIVYQYKLEFLKGDNNSTKIVFEKSNQQ